MLDLLTSWFAWLCGQNPAHTWTIAGSSLPCCQRCTGMFLGALTGITLQLILRPPLTRRFLLLNGAFTLQLGLAAWPAFPQPPSVRLISGVLYGSALAVFLTSRLPRRRDVPTAWRAWACVAGVGFCPALILALVSSHDRASALGLSFGIAAGALALSAFVLANAVWAFQFLAQYRAAREHSASSWGAAASAAFGPHRPNVKGQDR